MTEELINHYGIMPVRRISKEEARAMWPSEAETKAAAAERAKVVAYIERVAAIMSGVDVPLVLQGVAEDIRALAHHEGEAE